MRKMLTAVVAAVGLAALGLVAVGAAAQTGQKANFAGTWVLDQGRSYNLPRTVKQTMTVVQDGDKLTVETEIESEQGKRTVKDEYTLDGKEADFTPQIQNDPDAKGKRTGRWVPGGKSFVVEEAIATKNPEGAPVQITITRKWLLWADGSVSIDIHQDTPRGSSESRRFFNKK
jgi:hypothetical protein